MKNYKSPDALSAVAEFHSTFGHPDLVSPQIPDAKRCALRISLLQEELDELKDAVEDKDLVAVADALADIQYVLSGAILEFGLGSHFKGLFDEVQRSNMSKACTSQEEAEKTIAFFKQEQGVECYWEKKGENYLIYRSDDNKTMKSINYSPAQLKAILNQPAAND